MPKVTIDGQELEVEAGTTVLQAMLSQGAEIPHYCYHPGLSISGNCRMCLVEVEKAPKLLIACSTHVMDGMVVKTQSERVKQAQASVMEFLLVNHPLDCTICDQAGECRLQEYAVEYGTGKSRTVDPKVLNSKAVDLGKHVMLDQERCIQCSRCIRFCDEVSKTSELAFFQRGQRTMIGTYPGRRLDNAYSGNTVDICPVGALTLKEFRFQTRVWYLNNTPAICGGCARGCNIIVSVGTQQEIQTTRGQYDDRIKRVVPRVNDHVNSHWMCDEGRLSFQRQSDAERLENAQAPGTVELAWEEATERVARQLGDAAAAGRAAAIVSPQMTSESLFAWRKLFESLGGVRVGRQAISNGSDDELLVRADKGSNATGAGWIFGDATDAASIVDGAADGKFDTLLVFGDGLDPAQTMAIDERVAGKVTNLIYVGPFLDATARQASLLIPCAGWAEEDGSLVNFEGRVQWTRRCHLPRGEGRPAWRIALDVAAAAGKELPAWTTANEVLESLAAEVQPFGGLSEPALGLLGVRPEGVTA